MCLFFLLFLVLVVESSGEFVFGDGGDVENSGAAGGFELHHDNVAFVGAARENRPVTGEREGGDGGRGGEEFETRTPPLVSTHSSTTFSITTYLTWNEAADAAALGAESGNGGGVEVDDADAAAGE